MTRESATVLAIPKTRGVRPARIGETTIDPSLAATTLVCAVMLGLLLVTAALAGQAAPAHSVGRSSNSSISSTPPHSTGPLWNRATSGEVT